MTVEEFNKKYNDYLEKGHDGLKINNKEFIEWLDEKFQDFIKLPNFQFSQIKAKFGMGRFYCEGLDSDSIYEVEQKITKTCKI